jgi:DNA polymerase
MLFLDFETMSEMDIKKTGADAYARHPSTAVLCMAFAINDEPVKVFVPPEQQRRAMAIDPIPYEILSVFPKRLLDQIERGCKVVAHNAPFDQAIWNHCTQWPPIADDQLIDTASLARAMALPASLGELGKALGVKVLKSPTGTRLISKMCKPPVFETGPALMAEMAEYCARDVESMREIHGHMFPLSPQEAKAWLVNHRANLRGIPLDHDLIAECIRLAGEVDVELGQLAESSLGLSLSALRSPSQCLAWIEAQGQKPPKSLSAANLATYRPSCPQVQRMLELREEVCKTSIKKFSAMLDRMCDDGRARGSHVYHRATTGRFAGSGIQIQNLPRPALSDPDPIAQQVATTGSLPDELPCTKKTALSSLLRSCIKTDKEFYCFDYSAIESRVLFWLADEQKGLDVYRNGDDLYCVTASGIFGREITKADKERQIGKVAVLSLGYGGGVKAFQGMCEQMGVDLRGVDPKTVVDGYRETYAITAAFWKDCEKAAMLATENVGTAYRAGKCLFKWARGYLACRLPSKRIIRWPQAEIVEGATPWGAITPQIQYMGIGLNHKWQKQRTYGGDLAQSLTQATARDMIVDAMVRADDAGFNVVLHVHDEIMVEESEDRFDEFQTIMETPAPWATGCPIAVEGWRGTRYRK